MNILVAFLWLVKQDWCEAILEQCGVRRVLVVVVPYQS